MPVYLDNNATTRPLDAVCDAIDAAHRELWANPSSVHRDGQRVRQAMELARQQTARLIGAKPRDLVLTSGGTEANNLALHQATAPEPGPAAPCLVLTTPIEHAAIREPAERLARHGVQTRHLPVDGAGRVDPAAFNEAVDAALADAAGGRLLVSVQWANNETGVIQDMPALAGAVAAARDAATAAGTALLLHTDATQAVGKLPVDVAAVPVDLLTLAAHKFHGPKGVGALYAHRRVRLRPFQTGGPQETGRRGGTENAPAVIGMGVAAEAAAAFASDEAAVARVRAQRDRFESAVRDRFPNAVVNSGGAPRLFNTSNLGFPRLQAEAILLGLSEGGVSASAGAACSSGSLDPSPVLLAMGIPEPVAHGSVRFSLSRDTTDAELTDALERLAIVVDRLNASMW